jgi:hypothetical protein
LRREDCAKWVNKIPENIQILPKHKITLKCVVGEQIDPERRKIRNQ